MTINVAGLGELKKRRAFFKWMRMKRADVYLLTETHLPNERVERSWRFGWEGGGGIRLRDGAGGLTVARRTREERRSFSATDCMRLM